MKTVGILEVTDRLYGSNQRVYLNTQHSKDSQFNHSSDYTNRKPQSFEDLINTITLKKRALLEQLQRVRKEKQQAKQQHTKWRARLNSFRYKCEEIIGHQVNQEGKDLLDKRVPLANILHQSAVNQAVEYLSKAKRLDN